MRCVLYVNSKEPNCGVYQFGRAISGALSKSAKFQFACAEVDSLDGLAKAVDASRPEAIIYNYHPATTAWLKKRPTIRFNGPSIGTIHEITQTVADSATDELFDFHVAPDPTLLLKNPIVFKTGRLLPSYRNGFPKPERPVVGTWGFGYAGKGFEHVVRAVQQEFDEATIRLHVPISPFMDPQGSLAKEIADRCQALVAKSGVKLIVSHDFLSQQAMLDFLAQNSLNAFFYAENKGRGLSSVLDMALAVGRPIALTKSFMFRHVFDARPSIFVEDRNLRDILKSDTEPLQRYQREWTAENLVWDYERIVSNALDGYRAKQPSGIVANVKRKLRRQQVKLTAKAAAHFAKRVARFERKSRSAWITDSIENANGPRGAAIVPEPFVVSPAGERHYNRILDNGARRMYAPIIALLYSLVPDVMDRKIAAANVQQAFVFDAVRALAPANARILCVGSFEDTACIGLKMSGVMVEEIDPVINYGLDEFVTRPSTELGSYDIVFATSVLEHIDDDVTFMRHISSLLKPGGLAILTCDYNDNYKRGDEIPGVCWRMYTQKDFRERIIPSAVQCEPIDTPNWDCPNPDFVLADKYRYTFATLVLRKRS